MKHKVKRISKSSLSVVLSLCMLFSCFTAAFVATDAATIDSASTGDDPIYLKGSFNNWNDSNPMTAVDSGYYYCKVTIDTGDTYKINQGSTWYGLGANVTPDSDAQTLGSGGNLTFTGPAGEYFFWFKKSSSKLWIVSSTLYVDGYINGQDKLTTNGFQMQQSATDPTLYSANITTTTTPQYLVIYGAESRRYYNWQQEPLAAGNWKTPYYSTSTTIGQNKIYTDGLISGSTITVYFSTKDRGIMWDVTANPDPNFYITGNIHSEYLESVNGSSANVPSSSTTPSNGWWETQFNSMKVATDEGSGKYSIELKTKTLQQLAATGHGADINIGIMDTAQRAFKIGDTYYDKYGDDYNMPESGISSSDNAYIVNKVSGGSIILHPDTYYKITIDQAHPLNSSNPYGKLTIENLTVTVSTAVKYKGFNPTTGQTDSTVHDGDVSVGTASASPARIKSGTTTSLSAERGEATYTFEGWYSDAACTNRFSTTATGATSPAVNSDTTYYALFTAGEPSQKYTITAQSNDTSLGTASITGGLAADDGTKAYKGATVTITAVPASGKVLKTARTTSGNVSIDGNNIYLTGFTANTTVTAVFADATNIYFTAKSSTGSNHPTVQKNGSSISTGTYTPLEGGSSMSCYQATDADEITLTAQTISGQTFDKWIIEGGSYTITQGSLTDQTIKLKARGNFRAVANYISAGTTTSWKFNVWPEESGLTSSDSAVSTTRYQSYTYDGKTDIRIGYFTANDASPGHYHVQAYTDSKYYKKDGNNDLISSWQTLTKEASISSGDARFYHDSGSGTVYTLLLYCNTGSDDTVEVKVVKGRIEPGGSESDVIDDTSGESGYKTIYAKNGTCGGTAGWGYTKVTAGSTLQTDKLGIPSYKGYNDEYKTYYYQDNVNTTITVQTEVTRTGGWAVMAYVVNGETFMASQVGSSNVYKANIEVPAGSGDLEITPVYYNKPAFENKKYVKFYVDASTLGTAWADKQGNTTIGCYTWYSATKNNGNYPGQPMLKDGSGKYYMYVPEYYIEEDGTVSSTRIKGVLIDNYWENETVHKKFVGYNGSYYNLQSYDYYDPIAISKIAKVDTIQYVIKYKPNNSSYRIPLADPPRTSNANTDSNSNNLRDHKSYSNSHLASKYNDNYNQLGSSSTGSLSSGFASDSYYQWEDLTNYDGNKINLIGEEVTGTPSGTLYVVSVGNQNWNDSASDGQNIGKWATVWKVYNSSGTLIATAPPSYFIEHTDTAEYNLIDDTYSNYDVKISYEHEEVVKDGDHTGRSNGAENNSGIRIDGRWIYSKSTDPTNAKIKVVQVNTSDSTKYALVANNAGGTADVGAGYATKAQAEAAGNAAGSLYDVDVWFPNRETTATMRINVGNGYMFKGFRYMKLGSSAGTVLGGDFSDNVADYVDIPTQGTAADMTIDTNYCLVAVVEKLPATSFNLTHEKKASSQGKGYYYLTYRILDENNQVVTASGVATTGGNTTSSPANFTIQNFQNLNSYKDTYKLEVTLRTDPIGTSSFSRWLENDHNGGYEDLGDNGYNGTRAPNNATMTKTYPLSDFFNEAGTELLVQSLNFYSELAVAGTVGVLHTLTTDTTGTGTTVNQVRVLDSAGTAIYTSPESGHAATTNITPTYIVENSGNVLEITLKTTTTTGNFIKFSADNGQTIEIPTTVNSTFTDEDGYVYTITDSSVSGNVRTVKFTIPVESFFEIIDGESEFKTSAGALKFYSKLNLPTQGLTIEKTIDVTDTSTGFTMNVTMDGEEYTGAYTDVNGDPQTNFPSGGLAIKGGESITLTEVVVGSQITVTETPVNTYTYNGATVTNITTSADVTNGKRVTIADVSGQKITFNNKKKRTLTITKSADTSTSETFDFYVYKWNANASPADYELITTDPGFTYSGSGSFSDSTHKLTLAKDATASLTVYTGEKYKVVEVPKSGTTFEFSRTGSSVTDGTSVISTVGEVENGYDNIVIDNDTTAVTIRNNQVRNNVLITKTTNADYDYATNFKVRVQFSTDGGNTFTDLQALTLNVTHHDNTTGTVARDAIAGGGYQYSIKKGDVITVPDVVKGTIVRVIESDYVSDYYTFGGITSGNVTLTNVAGNNYAKQFTMGTADVNITVSNEFIPQTIRVTKKIYKKNGDNFSDYEYNDGSKFTMHVDLNPHGSGANYDPLGTGLVSVNGTGTATAPTGDGATAAAAGNYVVEKDGYIQFNNIPKGSRVEIQETAVGISPITGEQRFTTKELVQSAQATDSSATNLATGYITVNSDLNLVQRNIVKQNDVEIKKTTDSVDTTVDHTIHISAWDNGKPNHMYDGTTPHTATAAISTINYTRSTLGGTTTTESTSNGNITIHHGDTITLHYPVGTYYEITETAGTLYSYYNVSADTPDMASSTGGVNVPAPSVNTATGEVKFQTKDAKPEITYINNRNEYTYTIKKETNINNTDDEFKIKVWVKDNASVQNWTQYTAAIGQHTADATTGKYTIKKDETFTISGLKANSLIKVEETDVNSPKYAIGSIDAVGTDADFHFTQGETSAYTTVNADKGLVITNNVQTTTVTINKSVTGGATGKYTEFPLTVKITDESGSSSKTYAYTSSYTTSGSYTAHTGSVTNGTANSDVKIWGTETLTFTGVPVGATVEVTEGTMPTGYSCTSIGATGGANVTSNTKPNVTFKTTGSATAAVAIVNAVATHNVTITKAISNSNNSTEEFSISASIKPDGADDTAVTTWTRSIASAASASGSLSGMAIKNGESIVLENVPEGAEITVSEAAETDFTCQSIVAMDGNSTVIASANASTLTFTVPSSNATVTVTNKINDKTVTIHKVTDTATTGKSFKIKAQYTPTNTNTLTDYTSDSFSAGYATLGKDDTATVTVPKDASVTITELTGSDMPSGYEFEKITVDTTTSTAQNNGYTYTEQTDEDIYVHNTELHSVNLYKTTDNIGTTDTFTFKVYKWDTNASPNAWVQVDGDYTITANAAATATTTKFRKETLIKVVETPVTSGKYTYDHSGSSVANAADTSYSRPSGENGFENIKMGTSDVNVTLNNTVNTKTVKISKTADYTETTTGAFTFNVNTQEEGAASASNCTYKYKLNGTGSELDFTDGNVTIASGQFIEIYNVPVDTVVTVQETNAGQATSTTAVISNEKASTGSYNPETKTAAFTVGTSADPEVQFTNSKTKTLTITKTTDIADTSENFYIKVEKYDTSTSQYAAFNGSYSGPENRLNGGKFTIHHGESISISVNTNEQYRVYETDIPSYYTLASVTPTGASSATAYPASGTQTGSDVTIGESNVTVAFVNNIAKHDVTITKAVSNLTTADTFPISVTLNDPTTDSAVHNEYTCTYDGTNTPWGSATIADGTAQTFTVAQNKTVTIKNVPYGTTVTVNEVPAARYNCTGITVTGAADAGTQSGTDANRTLEFTTANAQAYVTVTNAVKTQDLTITKNVTNSAKNNDNFLITITIKPDGSSGSIQAQWVYTDSTLTTQNTDPQNLPTTIKNGQSYVISNVPVGAEVSVSEDDISSTDYSFSEIVVSPTVTETTGTQSKTFEMPVEDETVTIKNTINNKTVTVKKIVDDGSGSFPILVEVKNSNANDFSNYSGTGFTDGKVDIESGSAGVQISVPLDAEVRVSELTADIPTGYQFSKFTKQIGSADQTDETAVDVTNSGSTVIGKSYTYTGTDNATIIVNNVKVQNGLTVKKICDDGNPGDSTFRISVKYRRQSDSDDQTTYVDVANGGSEVINLPYGTIIKEVTETPVTGYVLDRITKGAADTEAFALFTLLGSETITVHNRLTKHTVTIEKEVVNESGTSIADSQVFNVSVQQDSSAATSHTFSKGSPVTLNNVPYGTVVTVSENNIPRGYEFVSITDDGSVTVDGNETITVTNKKLSSHGVKIKKVVDKDSGDTEFGMKISTTEIPYSYRKYNSLDVEQGTAVDMSSGGEATFNLKKDEYVIVSGLYKDEVLTVQETYNGSEYAFEKFVVNSADYTGTVTNQAMSYTVLSSPAMQTIDVSNVNAITTKYNITYNFTSYRSLYGDMSYSTGAQDFTATELTSLTSGTVKNVSGGDVTALKFNTVTAMKSFIDNHAPYEDGFRESVTWISGKVDNTDTNISTKFVTAPTDSDLAENGVKLSYNEAGNLLTIIVNAYQADVGPVEAIFKLPYKTTNGNDSLVPDGETPERINPLARDAVTTAQQGLVVIDGNLVQAPEKLSDGKYFSYWKMYTPESDIFNNSNMPYSKCYSRSFNFVLYQDSIIEAVYENTEAVSPHDEAVKDGNDQKATITFMENSRTQWNGYPDDNTTKYKDNVDWQLGDRVYSDFLISFEYNDLQLNTDNSNTYQYGVVIETLGDVKASMDNWDDEKGATKYTQSDYIAKFGSTHNANDVETFIKFGSAGSHTYSKSQKSVKGLDNKNRVDYYHAMALITQKYGDENWGKANNKEDYVYRAYSYLYNAKTGTVLLVSDPLYFTVYDIANINYQASATP